MSLGGHGDHDHSWSFKLWVVRVKRMEGLRGNPFRSISTYTMYRILVLVVSTLNCPGYGLSDHISGLLWVYEKLFLVQNESDLHFCA